MNENKQPICVGTGLITLDVILDNKENARKQFYSGGSCGNVLTILAYMGWNTYPVARLGNDRASNTILKEFRRFGVSTKYIFYDQKVQTPIIVQIIKTTKDGIPFHSFKTICPVCGSWLPRYRPVLATDMLSICEKLPKPAVLYLDRLSRGAINLVKDSRRKGALIFFEPTNISEIKHFQECLPYVDILKYSHERLSRKNDFLEKIKVPLQIETLGCSGLRFRHFSNPKAWNYINPHVIDEFKDAAGAGDWTSAGIIYHIGKNGAKSFLSKKENEIRRVLDRSQISASLNCKFLGARGLMYNMEKRNVKMAFKTLVKSGNAVTKQSLKKDVSSNSHLLCQMCKK